MEGLHIFSGDGVGQDLVVLRRDGVKLEGISAMNIRYAAGELPTVELTFRVEVVNLRAEHSGPATHKFVLPCCGQEYYHDCDGP